MPSHRSDLRLVEVVAKKVTVVKLEENTGDGGSCFVKVPSLVSTPGFSPSMNQI